LYSYIRSINLYSFHSFIYSNRSKEKVSRELYLCVAVVERRRWWRRRLAQMAVVALEEAGVDGGGGDRWSRERRGLREFWDEK
jgi:hypothetical protein